MKLLSSLRTLASTLFRRSRVDNEMEEELRAHIQHRADDLERSGVSRAEAERQARIEFGGYERSKEECRRAVGAHLLETLLQDVRYGLRLLRKSPGFTAVAVLTLALGIGANTAIFSLINTVMLRSLPVHDPGALAQLLISDPSRPGSPRSEFTNALWEQVRDHEDVFSGVFAWSADRFNLSKGGAAHPVDAIFVSGEYFSTLGVPTAAGRALTAADDRRGCPALAVLSYGFWQEHFGGAQSALDSTFSLDNQPFQIIGVSAPGFYGVEVGSKFDVAIPICAADKFDGNESRLDIRGYWWLNIMGRLKPGITPEQFRARLAILSPGIFAQAAPQKWGPERQKEFARNLLVPVPAATGISNLREGFGQPLRILMAVVGVVLLIASANLASLMLARANSRNKEVAVRKALGASRSRLVRQLLTECLLLSGVGAVLGIVFAQWGARLLVSYISTAQNRVFLDLSLDTRVLSFTAGIAIVSAVLFGILPALRSTSGSLTAAMKSGSAREMSQRKLVRPGKWIVGSQVAFCLLLVIVAGLFLRSLVKLATLDIGFDRANVLIVNADFKTSGVQSAARQSVANEISSRLSSLPGAISVGSSLRTPLSQGQWNQDVEIDWPGAPKGEDSSVYFNFISPGYFQTLRTPLLAGRNFSESDTKSSPSVVIVNEALARKFTGNTNPVGRYLRTIDPKGALGAPIQIVGLVKDAKYQSLREDTYPQAFFSLSQIPEEHDEEYFELRSATRPSDMVSAVQNAFAQVNKGISLDFHSLAEQVNDSIVEDRLLATLSGFFGGLALLLVMIGLYGALSYLVTQRRSEFGIRMALGAPPTSVLRLIMSELATIFLGGALAGIALSLASVRVLQQLLFGLSTHDLATMVGALVVLAAVALFAGCLPARRAMKTDPMVALRYE